MHLFILPVHVHLIDKSLYECFVERSSVCMPTTYCLHIQPRHFIPLPYTTYIWGAEGEAEEDKQPQPTNYCINSRSTEYINYW